MSFCRILLRLSFEEQLTWYVEDGDSYVNMSEDIRRVSISRRNNYVEAMVNARPANYPLISSVKEGYPTPNTCGDGDRVEKQGLSRQKEPSAERPAFFYR